MANRISVESPYLIPKGKDQIRDFIRGIPKNPGVYKFLDASKQPLYIGKAKSLNNRFGFSIEFI